MILIGFGAVAFGLYFAGRNAEHASSKRDLAEMVRLHQEAIDIGNETREGLLRLGGAYQRLHRRHFEMTGEAFQDLGQPATSPKTYDA